MHSLRLLYQQIYGHVGRWYLDSAHAFVTIQELIEDHNRQGTHVTSCTRIVCSQLRCLTGVLKRAAAILDVSPGLGPNECPNCQQPLNQVGSLIIALPSPCSIPGLFQALLETSPFCTGCGTRINSSVSHLELYGSRRQPSTLEPSDEDSGYTNQHLHDAANEPSTV
jgi:hypothetical protein